MIPVLFYSNQCEYSLDLLNAIKDLKDLLSPIVYVPIDLSNEQSQGEINLLKTILTIFEIELAPTLITQDGTLIEGRNNITSHFTELLKKKRPDLLADKKPNKYEKFENSNGQYNVANNQPVTLDEPEVEYSRIDSYDFLNNSKRDDYLPLGVPPKTFTNEDDIIAIPNSFPGKKPRRPSNLKGFKTKDEFANEDMSDDPLKMALRMAKERERDFNNPISSRTKISY